MPPVEAVPAVPLVEAVPPVTLAESAEAPSPAEGVPAVEAFDGLLGFPVRQHLGFEWSHARIVAGLRLHYSRLRQAAIRRAGIAYATAAGLPQSTNAADAHRRRTARAQALAALPRRPHHQGSPTEDLAG